MSFSNIFAGILFGAIGFSAFIYGKKEHLWKPMTIGITLIAFPYVVTGTAAQYVVGALLTLALFIFR